LRAAHVSAERVSERFGEEVIRLLDIDGMLLELIASAPSIEIQPWVDGPVLAEHSIRGFHSVTASVQSHERTARFLTETFGYRLVQEIGDRLRFAAPGETGAGRAIDLVARPDSPPGRLGAGTVHHIAFRVPDDSQQSAWREKLIGLGHDVSAIMDRVYFHSIYFREPGGVLFEIATDPPGFLKDETPNELGSTLCLPPWLEPARVQIEETLPKITVAQP
jgi:glyoxalase family protein